MKKKQNKLSNSFTTKTKFCQHRGVNPENLVPRIDPFFESEMKERWALKKAIKMMVGSRNHTFQMTPIGSKEHYDGFLILYDDMWKQERSYYIESKIRDRHYDDLLIEKYKIKEIKQLRKESHSDAEILYINFSPIGTWVWNIDKLEREENLKTTTLNCPVTTVGDSNERKDKSVFLLLTEKGKELNWIYTDGEYFLEQKPRATNRPYCLVDDFLKNDD